MVGIGFASCCCNPPGPDWTVVAGHTPCNMYTTDSDTNEKVLVGYGNVSRINPNLQRMISNAETVRASIDLEFPFGVNINQTLIEVSNALSQVSSYPENVDQPRLLSSSFSQNAFMYFSVAPLEGNPQNLDMDMMFDFVEDYVRPRM